MTDHFHPTENPAFTVFAPEFQTVPFVLNSPHSGRHYLQSFLDSSRLTPHSIRSSEDFLVDQLFLPASHLGIPMLKANFPRAYLDVNREPYELDQAMFMEELPAFANTKSIRVSSGLGTIAKIVAEGESIYASKLSVPDALSRIDTIYKPYHAALRGLLAQTHVEFGCAVMIDCHSMPSNNAAITSDRRPDFVLGDRFGSSCASSLTHSIRNILQRMGYFVELNRPYAGGFITEHYGRPENGLHTVQIEINRGLYMNEVTLSPNDGFDALADDLKDMMAEVIAQMDSRELAGSVPLAAE